MQRTPALAAALAACFLAAAAWAAPTRVAVLQPDAELYRAIALALEPWGIETLRSDAPLPRASQPEAAQEALRLGRELDVEAVVWVTAFEDGALLWVFDVGTGDVTTRVSPAAPPFDGASAAAVALSVKTVLRASAVAPPSERFGTHEVSPSDDRVAALEFGAGAQWVGERWFALRGELAGTWWLPESRRLGLGAGLASATGLRIATPEFDGQYRELALGAKARLRLVEAPGFATVLSLGGAAHWAVLRGTLAEGAESVGVERLNGSVDLGVSANLHLTERVYLAASASAEYFPRYRRYLVEGDAVFAPAPVYVNLTGICGVELF